VTVTLLQGDCLEVLARLPAGAVAIKHHRDYVGIELNPKYIDLTRRRLARVQPVLFAEA